MSQERPSKTMPLDMDPYVGRSIADIERDLIIKTLSRCGGNRNWAADILGIGMATLREKLISYSRTDPDAETDQADTWLAQLERYEPDRGLPS